MIFTSRRTADGQADYQSTADRMLELAARQSGFVSFQSVRGADGVGITISWWRDAESIRNWQQHPEHLAAQEEGRRRWYQEYSVQICQLLTERCWPAPVADASPPCRHPPGSVQEGRQSVKNLPQDRDV